MKAAFIFRYSLFCGDFVVILWSSTLFCFASPPLCFSTAVESATASPWEYEEYFGSFMQTFWHRPLGLPHQCSPAPLRPRRDPVPRCRWCVEAPLASAHEPGRPRPHPSQRPDKADFSHTAGEGITPQRPLKDGTSDTADGWSQVTPVRPRIA